MWAEWFLDLGKAIRHRNADTGVGINLVSTEIVKVKGMWLGSKILTTVLLEMTVMSKETSH